MNWFKIAAYILPAIPTIWCASRLLDSAHNNYEQVVLLLVMFGMIKIDFLLINLSSQNLGLNRMQAKTLYVLCELNSFPEASEYYGQAQELVTEIDDLQKKLNFANVIKSFLAILVVLALLANI